MSVLRPIGGFFELELPNVGSRVHPEATAFTSGRACFASLLLARKPRVVHLPFFCCDALVEPLQRLQIAYRFYAIDRSLVPAPLPNLGPDDLCVVIDYMGCQGEALVKAEAALGDRMVVDATQSFFRVPPGTAALFNSARKFFGVPDGGYLYGPSVAPLRPRESLAFAHLVERRLGNQERSYQLYKDAERYVSSEVHGMSPLSSDLLSLIDIPSVIEQRRRNFLRYQERLGKQCLIVPGSNDVPFFFPMMWPGPAPRTKFAQKNIFVPQFWPEIASRSEPDFAWERELSQRLVPLPLDHRYGDCDIDRVVDVALALLA